MSTGRAPEEIIVRPACELLEERAVLSNTITYSAATQVLTIDGSSARDHVEISRSATKLTVTMTHPGSALPARNLVINGTAGRIVFNGHEGDDVFRNPTGIAALANGGVGNDILDGGSAADQLFGGDGNDLLYGNAGNDQLYGGGGADILYGHDGADALCGWLGSDICIGGAGDDRFLFAGDDFILDRTTRDARINFVGTQIKEELFGETIIGTHPYWLEREIQDVDFALGKIQERVGNTSLLKMPDGGALTFRRHGHTANPASLLLGWNNLDGNITLLDHAFESSAWLHRSVYHEIAHNWEDAEVNPVWDSFVNLSGWTYSKTSPGANYTQAKETDPSLWFRVGSVFARDYGRSTPWEDWAVSVEAYFSQKYTNEMRAGAELVPAKVNAVEQFLNRKVS